VSARRGLVVAVGLASLGFGLWQLGSVGAPVGTVLLWLAAVLVVHDGVVAPLAAGTGALAARLAGRGPRWAAAVPVVGVGLAVGAVLALVAVPALLSPGVPGNPTVLPRAYLGGLAVLLVVDAAVTAAVATVRAVAATAVARRSAAGAGS